MEENFGKNNNKWKPGQSGNPNGRPKGSPNIVNSKIIRDQIAKFVHDKAFPDLFKNFESMSDRNKIELVTKLLPYFTPTLSASKNENIDGTDSKIKFQIVYEDTPTTHSDDDNINDADFESLPPPAPDDDLDF